MVRTNHILVVLAFRYACSIASTRVMTAGLHADACMHTQKTIEGQQSALNSKLQPEHDGGGGRAGVFLGRHGCLQRWRGRRRWRAAPGHVLFWAAGGHAAQPYRQALLNTHAIQTGMSARVMACVNNTLPAIRGAFCSLQCALA
jgi:hypothetical protein